MKKEIKLTDTELELIVNALIFTSSVDVCINDTYKFKPAAGLAAKLAKLQGDDAQFHAYLFKWCDGTYEDQETSDFLESNIKGLSVKT